MLYVLPGMGADSSMYQGAWRTLPDAVFLDWPDFRGEQTLADVADRFIAAHPIGPDDTLCGTSLGGMVALEIVRRIPVKKLILVSSALSPREVNPALRCASPLATVFMMSLAKRFARWIPPPAATGLRRADPRFLRAMCRAVVDWPGYDGPLPHLIRIHGDRDWIIRCPFDCDVVRGGGHLAAITHPDVCALLVAQAMRD